MNTDSIVMLVILVPLAAFFTGIGVYAMKREKPMWFWSGSTVSEDEIEDVPAYNRANGLMWIGYLLIFWLAAVLGVFNVAAAGLIVGLGAVVGAVALIFVYKAIYQKYRR